MESVQPVLDRKIWDPRKVFGVCADDDKTITKSNGSDHNVLYADRLSREPHLLGPSMLRTSAP